jgi:hypothetical protein
VGVAPSLPEMTTAIVPAVVSEWIVSKGTEHAIAAGVALLNEAHARDGNAPAVNAALAQCHLLRGAAQEAEALARQAVRNLQT